MQDPNLAITVPADVLAPNIGRISAGASLTTDLQIFYSKIQRLFMISNQLFMIRHQPKMANNISSNITAFGELTHRGRDKMAIILQKTFWKAFSWMKIPLFWFKFDWNLFPMVQLTINRHWFRQWLGAVEVTGHYLNQWWPCLLKHRCIIRPL